MARNQCWSTRRYAIRQAGNAESHQKPIEAVAAQAAAGIRRAEFAAGER